MGNEPSNVSPIQIDASVDETISKLSRLQSMTSKSGVNNVPPTPKNSPPFEPLTFKFPPALNRKRKSSVLIVNNGVTGKYISSRICHITAEFWNKNIENLSVADKLEIGVCIFFQMLSTNKEMKYIVKSNLTENKTIEETSLKYLDMMGWLIRHLVKDNIDFNSLLTKLGILHQRMGIRIQHFDPMLQAMHETFSYYFETKYNIQVKYAIDEIFTLTAQLMTGQNLKYSRHLMDISTQFQDKDIPFLKNLRVCLKSDIGKEYLYKFFAQTWCDEIAIFLQSLQRFKKVMSDKERFMIARDITKTSILPTAAFCLNLSYETRVNAINGMNKLDDKFLLKEEFEVATDFFHEIEVEIYKLIMDNHWKRFVEGIRILQSKSSSVQ